MNSRRMPPRKFVAHLRGSLRVVSSTSHFMEPMTHSSEVSGSCNSLSTFFRLRTGNASEINKLNDTSDWHLPWASSHTCEEPGYSDVSESLTCWRLKLDIGVAQRRGQLLNRLLVFSVLILLLDKPMKEMAFNNLFDKTICLFH